MQGDLFAKAERGPRMLLYKPGPGEAKLRYWEAFLPLAEADALLAWATQRLPFEQEFPVVGGQRVPTARRSCAVGDFSYLYRYVGIERRAAGWPLELAALRDRVAAAVGAPFNFCLCLLYPDGGAALGYHADDETDLLPGHPIASVSLGAVRDFAVREKREQPGPALLTFPMAHGSLLTMEGSFQARYQHAVPERKGVRFARVNFTFRQVVPHG
jgi:alkylated DNA repair dioxygenase AlkB